jgi:recombination protein RecT
MKELKKFEENMDKYYVTIRKLLGTKYGISAEEFMVKCVNAVKKEPQLLNCTPQSLFGSILYFAEIGLPFNTPEQFGYILPYKQKGILEATPIIGYKGLVEIAYRNPKLKSLRIQAVYDNDEFDYEYGTNEYIKHKPTHTNRGALQGVYAIAKMEGKEPIFIVVHKNELLKIQKISKSGGSAYSAYNNGTDVFNIMQSKVALKLLFKTLPKTENESLIRTLELDNKFDYDKTVRIEASEDGYQIIENEKTTQNALVETKFEEIEIKQTEAHKQMSEQQIFNEE